MIVLHGGVYSKQVCHFYCNLQCINNTFNEFLIIWIPLIRDIYFLIERYHVFYLRHVTYAHIFLNVEMLKNKWKRATVKRLKILRVIGYGV